MFDVRGASHLLHLVLLLHIPSPKLTRYRQLVAQKNAEKVLACNAAARKQPFYGSNENQEDDMRTSPPITTAHSSTKTPATLHHQYTPAVSDGSSSGSSGSSSSGAVSSQASSEGDSSTCANTNGSGRYNLLSELDAENESSSRAGRSNKENVTPSPSTLTVGTLDTVDKILGGMSAASSASMSVGSSHEKNKQQQQVQTVNVHPYGGGKKYMVSKKALRLEGHRQWAMVGEADADCDDSSSSGDISESGDSSSASSSISSMGSQRGEAVINASTDVVHGTPASRVHQDPGELLSTTGVSFLEDASYLDGEGDKDAGLNFHNNIGLLSPVAEADATEDDGMTTPAAPAVTDYAKQIYTFTPGSVIAGGDSDASSINDDASPASIGMFDQLESEWKDASSETSSDNSSEEDEKSNDEDNNGGTSAATTFLRDASMWVLPPEQDSSDDTISNAPSDETDGNIAQTPPESTAVGGGGNNVDNDGRQVLGELSISNDDYEESENINDDDEEEDDCVATLSPNRCLRTNAIDQALEETNVYMNKISDLESALHKAVQSAKVEAQKRRDCEKRIDELVMRQDQDQDQPFGVQTPAGITTLDLDLMNFSAFISPPTQDVDPEEVLAEAKEDRKLEQEQEQDLSTESSEMLDARAATASLMERNETLVKEIRFADQTCVELSERNAALERDVQRLDAELEASRKAHEDLRERLEKSVTHAAKLEERASTNAQKLSHQQSLFDAKMAATETELATAQIQTSSLQSKVDTMEEEKLALVADVAAANSKMRTIESSQSKESSLLSEIDDRREGEYEQTKNERDILTSKCSELEAQILLLSRNIDDKEMTKTPQKIIVTTDNAQNSASSRTPTSTVLAKTLQSQLERGNSVEDRACDAEKTIVALQMQLEASRVEIAAAKEEVRALRDAQQQQQIETGARTNGECEEEEEENETDSSVEFEEEDSAYAADTSASVEVETTGTANLRSQLHEALYDKKALLIEVSACKTSIQALEEQLALRSSATAQTKMSNGEAEEKLRLQQQRIEELTEHLMNLQTKHGSRTSQPSPATPSLASELTSSPAGDSKPVAAVSVTDAAIDTTFSTDRLERCEEGWATPAAKGIDNTCEQVKDETASTQMEGTVNHHPESGELQSQLDECNMQLRLALAELEAARAEAADMLNKLEEDKDILIEDNERVAASENEVLNANAQIEVKDIEIAALTRRCEEQGDAIEQYRALRLEDAKAVEDLRDELQEASAQSETLKQSLVDCNEKLASEIEGKLEMQEETSHLRTELASIRNQSQTVATDKDATIRELTTSNQCSRTVLENELDAAVQERDHLAKEAKKAISALQREISTAASSLRNLATSLDISEASIQANTKSGGQQQRQSHFTFSLRPPAQDRGDDSPLTTAHNDMAQLKATIDAVRERVEERDAHAFDMEAKNKRLSSDVSKLSKDANQLMVERDTAISKLTEKETSLVDTLVRQREDSSTALQDLKEKLAVVEEERNRLAATNEALSKKCSRLREYVKNLTQKCEEWSSSYRIQSTEIIQTKKENMDLTQKVSQMRSLVDGCPELDPSCTSCTQLRSIIEAQTQVRAALLHLG